jgi:hypothetical protein
MVFVQSVGPFTRGLANFRGIKSEEIRRRFKADKVIDQQLKHPAQQ